MTPAWTTRQVGFHLVSLGFGTLGWYPPGKPLPAEESPQSGDVGHDAGWDWRRQWCAGYECEAPGL